MSDKISIAFFKIHKTLSIFISIRNDKRSVDSTDYRTLSVSRFFSAVPTSIIFPFVLMPGESSEYTCQKSEYATVNLFSSAVTTSIIFTFVLMPHGHLLSFSHERK